MSDGLAAGTDREAACSRPLLKQKVLGGAPVSAMASSSVKRCQENRHNQLALYTLPRLEAFQRILRISFLAAISEPPGPVQRRLWSALGLRLKARVG